MTETTERLEVICIGEALVDFLPERPGARVADVERWTRCSGGSPANVAVGLSRLGARSALVGCIGQDEFGDFLKQSLASEGVDVSHLRQTAEGKTGLVFVSLTESGERSFSFHRTLAAELFFGAKDVDLAWLERTRAIHTGTNSLLWKEAQEAAVTLVQAASRDGRIVCCDPNPRLHLWKDPTELQRLIHRIFASCTVAKVSEDEIGFVTGTTDVEQALRFIERLGVFLPVVTEGAKGASFLWEGERVHVPAPHVKVVDTTGAGDGFTSAFLFGLTRLYEDARALRAARVEDLRALATFGCEVGSRVIQKFGAVAGLPRASELSGIIPERLRT